MKTINANTKQGKRYIEMYTNSNTRSVMEAYGRWSRNKRIAEIYCKNLMNGEGGWGYKIISYNTFQFTAAWRIPGGIRIETRDNSYFVKEA